MKRFRYPFVALAAALAMLVVTAASAAPPPRVVVYVESQGLCYESVITAKQLPPLGPFQVLQNDPANHCGGPSLKTQFGPGDVGYLGGRWVLTMPDGETVYFECPLLPPGYEPESNAEA